MTTPFPTPYPTLLGDDPALGKALATAISEVHASFPGLARPLRTAISFVAVDGFRHAGAKYGETMYSASLLKVAVLYAAFELKRSASTAAASESSPAAVFNRLHRDFDGTIDGSVPALKGQPGLPLEKRLPKYEQIFTPVRASGGGFACEFQQPFRTNLINMITKSDNNAAAACIQALGYSWINGTLNAGGFFFPLANSGVWIAGTFVKALPVVTVPSTNDGLVAQAATTFDLANMYAHLVNGTLVDRASSNQMLALLATSAAVGPDPSFLDFTRRRGLPPRGFGVTHTKIGLGPLKTKQMVASEGTILEHNRTDQTFIVVFQNSFNDNNSIFALGQLVERTMELFLAGP